VSSIWTFDFGKVTGVTHGWYGPTKPYELVCNWHVRGGLQGFMEWMELNGMFITPRFPGDVVVAEKFTQSPGNDFLANIDGIPIEGALAMAIYPNPVVWQTRNQKQKAGMYDAILKEHGLWVTGDDVEWGDGRDANDCIIHALEYLRTTAKHLPTLRKYFKED
jgi:hypothetical protein